MPAPNIKSRRETCFGGQQISFKHDTKYGFPLFKHCTIKVYTERSTHFHGRLHGERTRKAEFIDTTGIWAVFVFSMSSKIPLNSLEGTHATFQTVQTTGNALLSGIIIDRRNGWMLKSCSF